MSAQAPISLEEQARQKSDKPKQIEARGLVKTYGNKNVVNGIDLTVSVGEVVGLLGPNGA
jgi:lipopolysaccharide export system ATP-binding protein